jgi:hypothetical protein
MTKRNFFAMRQFWLPLCFALSLSQAALPPRFTQLGWGDGGDIFDDGDVDEEGKGRSLHAALHPPKVVAEVISVGGAAVNWCTKDQQKTLWECGEKAGYDQAARCVCSALPSPSELIA